MIINLIKTLFFKRHYKVNTSKLKNRLLCTDYDGDLK